MEQTEDKSADQQGKGTQDPSSSSNRLPRAPIFTLPKRPNLRRPERLSRVKTLLVAGLVILGVASGLLGGWIESKINDGDSFGGASLSSQKKVVTSESQLINQIAKTVGKSVVSVNVVSEQQSQTDFFGFGGSTMERSAGTGIIISKDGLIITNRHVVPDGTTNVSVTLSDGTELKKVKVIGRTSNTDNLDIAFLKIEDAQGKKLFPAEIGDSSKVRVGDAVVAIGNALGQFQNTVTSGIISGYGRNVQASEQGTGTNAESLTDLFQTDAAINEGNSGGPLVNMNGQVIGINTAIAGGDAQNIGFAIPINDAKGLMKQVVSTGELKRPYLGVRYVPLTADYAYEFNLPVDRGAYVAPSQVTGQPSIISGSPADKAGLKEKDIITQVDGMNIDERHSLTSLLSQHSPGDKVKLTVVRKDKTLHLTIKLGTAPKSTSSSRQ